MFIDIRSDYSLLESLLSPEKVIEFSKQQGWTHLGIADTNAGGLLDFYLLCKDAGIKPILGLSFTITDNLENITDSKVLLYAQNLSGYHNLVKLSSRANLEGKGTILLDWLKELGNDLLCVLPIGHSPNELSSEQGKNIIKNLQKLFKGKLFFGLYNRNTATDDVWLNKAKQNKTPYLFLSGAKYLLREDILAYKALRAIKEKNIISKIFEAIWLDESIESSKQRMIYYEHKDYYNKFLNLIDIDIPTPGLKVPRFAVPAPFKSSYEYLVDLCRKGYGVKSSEFTDKKQVSDRMKTELDVIQKCELSDYFLLVYGICQYCDSAGIPRGLGRGSVGGSLCAYLMDIHKVNPIKYGLLFERFLNPDRTRPLIFNEEQYLTDAPDIDLDIGQLQRQQAIDWLREKYGFVSKISTYTTLSAKICIRETVRTFGKIEGEAAYASSFVDALYGKMDSISKTYEKHEKFRNWAERNQEIYKVALKLEGLKKNSSIHAAGILISDQNIENKAPLTLLHTTGDEFKQDVCCSYDLDLAAKAALLKVDVLGIRTLNLLQDTIKLIESRGGLQKTTISAKEVEDKRTKKVWKEFLTQNA